MSGNLDVYFKLTNKTFLYFFPLRTLFTKIWLPLLIKEILPKNDVNFKKIFGWHHFEILISLKI